MLREKPTIPPLPGRTRGQKKKEPRRALDIVGTDTTLEISRATMIKSDGDYEAIHFDKLKDGTWRLTWTDKTVKDFSDVEELVLRMVRE